ncbi:MAG: hypothetical protein KA133_00815 [Flavobacterium sp.]|jgi:hypothetical protein|nr:hypothetical protein [Flavobacterium sp.]
MFLIVAKYLIPKGYRGLAIFPFVLVKHSSDKKNLVFLNHERIHLRQQLELLVIPFFVLYLMDFFVKLVRYKNFDLAYRNICFEREAYANEICLQYLTKRPFWGFLKFI